MDSTTTFLSGNVETICSMDFYGLFIGMDSGNTNVVRIEINIADDGANPP